MADTTRIQNVRTAGTTSVDSRLELAREPQLTRLPIDLHERASPGLLDQRVTLPQAPQRATPVRELAPTPGIEAHALTDYDALYQGMLNKIDPRGLIAAFRSGNLQPEMLEGEAGQLLMMQLKDKMTMLQAFMDGLQGIMDIHNQALKRAAQNLGS